MKCDFIYSYRNNLMPSLFSLLTILSVTAAVTHTQSCATLLCPHP